MAGNKRQGIAEVETDNDVYHFKADFSLLSALEDKGIEPFECYYELLSNKAKTDEVITVLECAIIDKNGEPIGKASDEIASLIRLKGFNDCWVLCRYLFAMAMVGDEKKSQLVKLEPSKLTELITEPFKLESSKNRRYLWAYHLLISGLCVCISFSLFALLIQYNTDFERMVLTLIK